MQKFDLEDLVVFQDEVRLKKPSVSKDKYLLFDELSNVNSDIFTSSRTFSEFIKHNKAMNGIMQKMEASESFYRKKNGFEFTYQPAILFYAAGYFLDKYPEDFSKYPSYYLQMFIKEFNNYIDDSKTPAENSVSVMDFLSCLKIQCKLVNKFNLRVDHDTGYSEVFVNNAGICIVDTKALKGISSFTDLQKLNYDANLGILYDGKPLRTLHDVFLIKNDLDWR